MIDTLDDILRDLIQSRIPSLAGASQVGFDPPNDDWRQSLLAANEERVNFYLYNIRENLKLRTNERTRVEEQGWYRESPPAVRTDCHYLVTAWSPIAFQPPQGEPTYHEHGLLYRVLDVLLRNRPLSPVVVYSQPVPSGNTITTVPVSVRGDEFPLDAAYPEGMRDQGDFWGTMKVVWRPSIELVVTIPFLLDQDDIESPMVTSLVASYAMSQGGAAGEEIASIGGRVIDPAGDGLAGAWVQVRGVAPPALLPVSRWTISQPDGTFQFDGLPLGQYHLRTQAQVLGGIGRDVFVPSETGEFDLRFP